MSDEDDLGYYFNSIITKGRKDNTYKFALARFLIDYSYNLDISYIKRKLKNTELEKIEFSDIAKSFLKYYWHQICRYKIRQNYNPEKLPLIVQIIHNEFGEEYIPEPFENMDHEKIRSAEGMIRKKCFLEVIPRFQNIPEGTSVSSKQIFYEYDNDSISVKPQALLFFKANYSLAGKAVILEWAKFLEKINHGLPRLISKIESEGFKRKSLINYQQILREKFDSCFYCGTSLVLENASTHVDHFIPWSYIFEDELWNLVLTCSECNLKKHDSLPHEKHIERLVKRNSDHLNEIEALKRSVERLDVERNQKQIISKYYQNCLDYGFTRIDL